MATNKSVALPKAVGDDEDGRTLPHMSLEAPSIPRIFQSWMAHLGIQTLDDCASESGTAGEDDQRHGSQVAGDAPQQIIPTQDIYAGSSGSVGEDEHGHELSDLKCKSPISVQPGNNPTGYMKNVDHSSITIPEPSDHFCRICGPDETTDDPNNFLVDLGCDCKESLSKMHRKCALEWFGPRIYVKNDHRCELCMARVDDSVQAVTLGAYFSGDSSREVVVRAVSSQMRLGNNNVAPLINFAMFQPIVNSVRTLRRITDWKCTFTTLAIILVTALFILGLKVSVKHYWPHLH